MNYFNSELQLKDTEFAIRPTITEKILLTKLKGFKLVKTLVIELKKLTVMMQHNNSITQYSNSTYYLTITESKIDDIFESVYTTIVSSKQKYIGKSLGWITDSVFSHFINVKA